MALRAVSPIGTERSFLPLPRTWTDRTLQSRSWARRPESSLTRRPHEYIVSRAATSRRHVITTRARLAGELLLSRGGSSLSGASSKWIIWDAVRNLGSRFPGFGSARFLMG